MRNQQTTKKELDANIKRTNELLDSMNQLLVSIELTGKEDTSKLEANIKKMQELSAKNRARLQQLREETNND